MSIKNGLLYSVIGLGISGASCSLFLNMYNKKLNIVEDENIVLKKSYFSSKRVCDVIVLGTGLVGFLYGYKRNVLPYCK